MIEWLLDRVALSPTRNPIEGESLSSSWIPSSGSQVELFERRLDPVRESDPSRINVIKFLGAGGRAENVSQHPFDTWPTHSGRIWVANPPGYGQSPGRASLRSAFETGCSVYEHVRSRSPSSSLPFLSGNSLGGTVAICVASRFPVCGMVVRDMPDISGVIHHRYSAFPRLAEMVSNCIPSDLEILDAARSCQVPAVFVSSRRDRIVPAVVQDRVIAEYAGPKRIICLPEADHMAPLSGKEFSQYAHAMQWLYDSIQG